MLYLISKDFMVLLQRIAKDNYIDSANNPLMGGVNATNVSLPKS